MVACLQATKFIAFPLGIFFGGLTMLLVAMWEFVRRNVLGATAFGTYGAFWVSLACLPWMAATGTCQCS